MECHAKTVNQILYVLSNGHLVECVIPSSVALGLNCTDHSTECDSGSKLH